MSIQVRELLRYREEDAEMSQGDLRGIVTEVICGHTKTKVTFRVI